MEVRVLHRLESVLADVGEVSREDAAEKVGDLGAGDQLEESRGGVGACSFATRGVGALCERVKGECELEEWVAEDVRREELARPDDVGVPEMGEDVVAAEFCFVGSGNGGVGYTSVVVELVERFEDCWPTVSEGRDRGETGKLTLAKLLQLLTLAEATLLP
jgi:hypothetical protein